MALNDVSERGKGEREREISIFFFYKYVRSYFDDETSSLELGIRMTVDAADVNLVCSSPFAFKRSSDLVSKMVGVACSNGDWDNDDGADNECVLH